MTHQPTITEIVSFILRHRRNNAFTEETPEQLYEYLQIAIVGNNVLVDSDDFGFIRGVILAESFSDDKRLHIYGILCLCSNSLFKFSWWLQKEVERRNWRITATRHGRCVEYDTQKILKKLISKYNK